MPMTEGTLRILAVVGSLQQGSVTRVVLRNLAGRLEQAGCAVDMLDLQQEPLALYNPDSAYELPGFSKLQARVHQADVFLLGTPDYHGSVSSALKNFLDHFWHEFAGKLMVPLVASHEKGLTVIDQLGTIARQCYAWTLPYGIGFAEKTDVAGGEIVSESLKKRLDMAARDARVYGGLLAAQRRADLTGADSCFMAKHRE